MELMVAARQVVDAGLRGGARIELGMRVRYDLVLQPVDDMDGDIVWKSRTEIVR